MKKAQHSIYLKISPGTIIFKKLMEKAEAENTTWQDVANTILKASLLNLNTQKTTKQPESSAHTSPNSC